MRRLITGRLAIAVGCALATATFTGGALAGGGNSARTLRGSRRRTKRRRRRSQPGAAAPARLRAQSSATASPPATTRRPARRRTEQQAPSSSGADAGSGAVRQQLARPGEAGRRSGVVRARRPASSRAATTTHWTHCTHRRRRHRHRELHRAGGHADVEGRRLEAVRQRQDGCADRGQPRRAERHADHRPGQQPAAQGVGLRQAEQQDGGVDVHADQELRRLGLPAETTQPTAAGRSRPRSRRCAGRRRSSRARRRSSACCTASTST